MKNLIILFVKIILIINIFNFYLYAQNSAGSLAEQEMRSLVYLQTSGIPQSGNIAVELEILPLGLLISKFEIAVSSYLSFGVSYGAANLIGSGKIEFNELPGFHAKLRFFTETRIIPSIALGFNSQGRGLFIDSLNRYELKSPGIFLAISKNFKFLGFLCFHSQINYSLKMKDDDNLNLGIGIEKTLGTSISFVAEYDFALNDNSERSLGNGKGYLNIGLRLAASKDLTLGFNYINLLDNLKPTYLKEPERSLFLEYSTNLF